MHYKIIYYRCQGLIGKAALMITVWHCETCPVMMNEDCGGQISVSLTHKL